MAAQYFVAVLGGIALAVVSLSIFSGQLMAPSDRGSGAAEPPRPRSLAAPWHRLAAHRRQAQSDAQLRSRARRTSWRWMTSSRGYYDCWSQMSAPRSSLGSHHTHLAQVDSAAWHHVWWSAVLCLPERAGTRALSTYRARRTRNSRFRATPLAQMPTASNGGCGFSLGWQARIVALETQLHTHVTTTVVAAPARREGGPEPGAKCQTENCVLYFNSARLTTTSLPIARVEHASLGLWALARERWGMVGGGCWCT